MLTTDRVGGIIYNAIEGETVKYNGKDYKYTGIADVKVDQKDDGTVEYTFKIKEGVKFSDGVELTADDEFFYGGYTILEGDITKYAWNDYKLYIYLDGILSYV